MATQKKKIGTQLDFYFGYEKKKTCDETADLVDVSRVWVDN